jgi:hypothetical protein
MRYALWLLPLVLAGCATPGADKGIEIETTHAGKAINDAQCTVTTDAGSWQVTTPGTAPVGTPSGDLRVVCDKPGYRTSEVVYRATPGTSNMSIGIGGGSGGGRVGVGFGFGIPIGQGRTTYPSRIVVDMNPQ